MNDTRKWSMAATVLVLAIVAAGWFLLVAPKRSEASDLKAQAVQQDQANTDLEAKLAELKAQKADIPKQQARLAVFRRQIPDNPALPSLVRNLSTAAKDVGVSLDQLSPAAPVAVVSTSPVAVAPDPAATTDASSTESSDTTSTTPAPAPVAPAPTLYQVPLSLGVTGSYFELEQFVNRLEGLKRSLLVTGFTIGPASSDAAEPNDLTVNIQGRVFIAPPVEATTTTTVAPATTGQ
jgi:Tfp pilus assembly protein PilO